MATQRNCGEFLMETFSILGSDSEDEMYTKWEYIEALKLVHQMDGNYNESTPGLCSFILNRI